MSLVATGNKTAEQPETFNIRRQNSLLRDAVRRFSRNKLAMAGLVIVVFLLILAVFADLLAPYPYDFAQLAKARQFPSAEHWLGTDEVGRDELSRIIYGARISLTVGFAVQAIALLIGVSLGMLAGFIGGWADFVVMRIVEVFTAIPQMLFALFLVAIFGNGMLNIIMAIALIGWVDICRLTRAQIFSLREKEYIEAARTLGVTPFQIALRHLLPNALTPLIIAVTIGIPTAIFTEAGLSFLGVGINDPLPSWGKMVGNAASNPSYLLLYWHLALFPTLAIAISMLAFSLMGDGLRDALDPRSSKA
jgi:ABC-type dipeptide/oligopeptide/nickel transport system permease subunit